jgi:hypothetical protein
LSFLVNNNNNIIMMMQRSSFIRYVRRKFKLVARPPCIVWTDYFVDPILSLFDAHMFAL